MPLFYVQTGRLLVRFQHWAKRKKGNIHMCVPGRAVICGATFALVPLKEIREREIKLIKTNQYVLLYGEEKPVYEKFNWDECPKINQMFDELHVEEHRLEDFLVENVTKRLLMGFDY